MFCSECGAQINDNAVVCVKCGVPVKTAKPVVENVPNHLVGAILTTLFCCLIGGIVAIVYACQVNTKLAAGDIEGAKAASSTAKTWIIVNIVTGLVLVVLQILLTIAAGV